MAVLTKVFNGSVLNSDDAHEYMSPTDLVDGSGVRIQSQEGNSQGLVKTLEGNREIVRSLPSGVNTILRAKTFPEVKKTYIFTKNSNGNHCIEEFDYITESFSTLFEDLTDSGSEQLLDWSSVTYIKDVVLIQGTLLYWTEFPNDIVRRLDVVKAKTDPLFNTDTFYISVPPPMYAPDVEYNSDSEYAYNNLTGNLFQFRYRFKYPNSENSAWSPISERSIPTGEPLYQTSMKSFNALRVSVPYDSSKNIVGIDIAARHNESLWYTIKSVDMAYIQSLPAEPSIPPINDPSNPQLIDPKEFTTDFGSIKKYWFTFYNDALYPTDDQLEHQLLSDYVPENTRALESVNDNTILLGNNRVGKPRPDVSDSISLEIILNNPDGAGNISTFKVDWIATGYNAATNRNYNTIQFSGDPEEGDEVTADFQAFGTVANRSYTVPSGQVGNLPAVINSFAATLPPSQVFDMIVVGVNPVIMRYESIPSGSSRWDLLSAKVVAASATSFNNSIPTLKLGASYEIMAAFYDNKGRPFPLARVGTVKLPTYANTLGYYPTIGWNVSGLAPEGAKYFQLLSSLNRTHEFTKYTIADIDTNRTDADWLWLNITPLFDFNAQYPDGNLGYEWQAGDRLVPVAYFSDFAPDGLFNHFRDKPFVGDCTYDLEIVEYVLDSDQHFIRVKRPPENILTVDIPPMLIEIYRKKTGVSVEDEIYYEVTPTYQIDESTRTYLQTSGEIKAVDSFFKFRQMEFTLDSDPIGYREFWAETFHFSDTIKSDYWNLGRPRSYYDTPEVSHLKSEIRHSREWISGSRVNNIVRFYPEDVYDAREPMYGAQENYGGIQYLQNRENRLICVQELKVGYIPVNRSIIEDTVEQQQIGISSKLLNPISYYAGSNIGIGNDYAVPSFIYVNGSCYFVDPVGMLPVRAGLDGTRHIGYKYTGALNDKIRQHIRNGDYLKSLFDDRFNEWLLLFPDTTWAFDEKIDGWVPKKPYLPEAGFSADDRFYTLKDGKLYVHDDEINRNVFYGVAYPAEISFSVTSPGVKTFRSIEEHSDDLMVTEELGIETQLGQVSELNLESDYDWNGEGVYLSNLLFDHNSPGGIPSGDLLKGRYILFKLRREAGSTKPMGEINLLKFVVKDTYSTPNIT